MLNCSNVTLDCNTSITQYNFNIYYMRHKSVSLTQEVSGRDQLQSLFLIIHQPLCPAVPLRLVNIREDVSLPPAVPSQHPPFTVKTGSG